MTGNDTSVTPIVVKGIGESKFPKLTFSLRAWFGWQLRRMDTHGICGSKSCSSGPGEIGKPMDNSIFAIVPYGWTYIPLRSFSDLSSQMHQCCPEVLKMRT